MIRLVPTSPKYQNPLAPILRGIRKAQRDFKSVPLDKSQKAAEVCKRILESNELQKKCTGSPELARRVHILKQDVECLFIRIRNAEAQKRLDEKSMSHPPCVSLQRPVFVLQPVLPDRDDKAAVVKEFERLLEKLGLDKQLRYEACYGDSPEFRFYHSPDELEATSCVYPELYSFLPLYRCTSEKGMVTVKSPADNVQPLLKKAESYFRSRMTPLAAQLRFNKACLRSDATILKEIFHFKKFQGLFIGDDHGHQSPKQFVIGNMKTLKELKVKRIFLEGLFYDTLQPLCEAYFASADDEMPSLLANYLKLIDQKYGLYNLPCSYTELVRQAKVHGIKVIFIDTSVTQAAGGEVRNAEEVEERIIAFNYQAKMIIDYEKGKDNYVILAGAYHGPNIKFHKKTIFPIPGLATLLGCFFLLIEDADVDQNGCNQQTVNDMHLALKRQKQFTPPSRSPSKVGI